MGRAVAEVVASRMGKSLLELGGNNAMILAPSADLDMAKRAITFSAVGTCGQRCTTLRRLFVHESVKEQVVTSLKKAYESLSIGSPLDSDTLIGPLIDQDAFDLMQKAISDAVEQGGAVITGGERVEVDGEGYYVRPAIIEMPSQSDVVMHETFAPILYVMTYSDVDEAIDAQNAVPQGLSLIHI